MMFAVLMIALNGLIGVSLLLGGLRYREQQYNLQGTGAYLNTIMALAVLSLILPDFTTSLSGPRLKTGQETFLIIVSLSLYVISHFIQVRRHSGFFRQSSGVNSADEVEHHHLVVRSTPFHVVMLFGTSSSWSYWRRNLACPWITASSGSACRRR